MIAHLRFIHFTIVFSIGILLYAAIFSSKHDLEKVHEELVAISDSTIAWGVYEIPFGVYRETKVTGFKDALDKWIDADLPFNPNSESLPEYFENHRGALETEDILQGNRFYGFGTGLVDDAYKSKNEQGFSRLGADFTSTLFSRHKRHYLTRAKQSGLHGCLSPTALDPDAYVTCLDELGLEYAEAWSVGDYVKVWGAALSYNKLPEEIRITSVSIKVDGRHAHALVDIGKMWGGSEQCNVKDFPPVVKKRCEKNRLLSWIKLTISSNEIKPKVYANRVVYTFYGSDLPAGIDSNGFDVAKLTLRLSFINHKLNPLEKFIAKADHKKDWKVKPFSKVFTNLYLYSKDIQEVKLTTLKTFLEREIKDKRQNISLSGFNVSYNLIQVFGPAFILVMLLYFRSHLLALIHSSNATEDSVIVVDAPWIGLHMKDGLSRFMVNTTLVYLPFFISLMIIAIDYYRNAGFYTYSGHISPVILSNALMMAMFFCIAVNTHGLLTVVSKFDYRVKLT